jgi:uncharacterized membrane protein
MVNFKRLVRHLFMPPWAWRRAFPQATLDAIEAAIRASEAAHSGEIRFAIENSLPAILVVRGMSGRARAIEMFSNLRVWDTEANSGVLVYLLLADGDIEIVADRGAVRVAPPGHWQRLVAGMQDAFRAGRFEAGLLDAVAAVDSLLVQHYALAPGEANPNELPDRPALL